MQLRIFPVFKRPQAFKTRTRKVRRLIVVQRDEDVFSNDQMLAGGAITRLVEAPPLSVRIVLIEQTQSAASG